MNEPKTFFTIQKNAVCRDFRHTAEDGKTHDTKHHRIVQDQLFESDFDRAIKQLPKPGEQS